MSVSGSRPLFIIGYPRSGTTLLLHLVLSSGAFPTYPFDETHFYSHHYRRYRGFSRRRRWKSFIAAVSRSQWMSLTPVSVEDIESRADEDGYGPFLRAHFELLAEQQGKERWVEKTPWHALYLDVISRDFPDAQFIHIVRDPRDIALSIVRAGWITPSRLAAARMASSWSWLVQQVHSACPEDQLLTIKYEDLIQRPDLVLERVNDLLGTAIDMTRIKEESVGVLRRSNSSFGGTAGGFSKASVGRWRTSELASVVSTVNGIARKELLALGYEPGIASGDRLWPRMIPLLYGVQKRTRRCLFPLVRR